MDDWKSIGVHEFLNADRRPSMIVDLGTSSSDQPTICFRNQFFTSTYGFDNTVTSESSSDRFEFQNWAFYPTPTTFSVSCEYAGHIWIANTLRDRWRVIQAANLRPDRSVESFIKVDPRIKQDHFQRLEAWAQAEPHLDWASKVPPPNATPFIEALRRTDWGKTPLGPMESWSTLLRFMTNLVIADPHPVSCPSLTYTHYFPANKLLVMLILGENVR
jgi:hypothetical protein